MPRFHLAPAQFIEQLGELIRDEFDCQRRAFSERCARPVEERVESGECLAGLVFDRIDQEGRAHFRHEGNHSRLREGDRVLLNRGEPMKGLAATLYFEDSRKLTLSSQAGFEGATFLGEAAGWLLDENFIDLEDHYLRALELLPKTEIGQERVLPLLLGEAEGEMDEGVYQESYEELEREDSAIRWEDKQKEAIAGCVSASHCYLVQGPPGTGKTRVLAQVVAQLVAAGERVLVTGPTHLAIDHALAAAAVVIGDRSKVARFGEITHGRRREFDTYEDFAASKLDEQNGWVAGATPFALGKRLVGVEFDTVIMDEAGQMTTPLALMAMLKGRKYLLFGDHQQLGPVLVSRPRREGAKFGIFQALKAQAKHGTMLDITYRLNETLTRWPSESFYWGELSAAAGAAHRQLRWAAEAQTSPWLRAALAGESPLVWITFPGRAARTRNEAEIAVAAELLQALTRGGVAREDIAVVTPYRRQARFLRNRIEQMEPSFSWRGCLIDTVERMQGQEREVILLSWCAAEPEFICRQFQFLLDPRRLNVAATRARTKLIILANENLTHFSPLDSDDEEDMALLRALKAAAVPISPPDQA
jgi:DNA replication ATP-dependent helicase Dna2